MNDDLKSQDPAANLYLGVSGQKYHGEKRALRPEALPWVMALRAEKFQRYVQPTDVVFELGVGSGWNLGQLRCRQRIGCDVSEFLADTVKSLDIQFVKDIKEVADATAQVVICHQTLEHLLDPAATLKQLARILTPQGKLILHVPWEREWRYSRYLADEPNHHLYNWNAQNLGNLVTVLGYKIQSLSVRSYGYDRFAANLAVRLHAGERGFKMIRACMIALRPLREIELIASR